MTDDNGKLKHFAAPASTPIIGQPFTFLTLLIPVSATLACHCGGADTTVTIALSTPGVCPSCRKTYNVGLNPSTMQLEIAMSVAADAQKDPS